MHKLNIGIRIYLVVGLAVLSVVVMSLMSTIETTSTKEQGRAEELVSVADTALAIAKARYEAAAAGTATIDEAQQGALDAIADMRYRGGEYLFVIDNTGTVVMHPIKPELDGTNQIGLEDPNGKKLFAEMVEVANSSGQGYVEYQWPRADSEVPVDKLSYVTYFPDWNWIIGTGVYVDDLRAQNAAIMQSQVIKTVGLSLIVLALAWFIGRSITKPIGAITETMGVLSGGNFDVEVPGKDRGDEIGKMAQAVEVFRENGIKMDSMTEEEKAAAQRRTAERAEMMQELQSAFGDVVDAAIAGDLSKRVTSEFPDAELNNLARSVNNLVETVDKGISETGGVLAALADTDLTHRVTGDYKGAFDQLKVNTNTVAEKLSDVISQVKDTSRGLKTATGEILSGANDLSERTTKQAATIEETSAAMEELANTVMTNAKRAEDASIEARNVSETAEAGGAVMSQANTAMERISASSEKISNIIGMIDDIAFQTNLLALNASVEAARAGEAGKGFAVVAVEVRRLAQSAAEASNEVKALIEQSGTEVGEGSKLVADAAEKLTSMLDAVRQNAELMQTIATDSKEQASAIEEVNVAVRQMDEMTQHNAALVEETNAAIEQTEAQASELDRIVEVFKLDPAGSETAPKKSSGVRELQDKVVNAAKTYLGGKAGGGAAAAATATAAAEQDDWAEF